MTDKVIVTNVGALRAKYGAAGWRKIRAALDRMAAADDARGVVTKVVALDDERTMRGYGADPFSDPHEYELAKQAVDAVFRKDTPAYLMILGAPDVVPHQPLLSPVWEPPDDPDEIAWSDLPYACSGRFDTDIASFTGPTRVVGRLPDVTGATRHSDVEHVVRLLDNAAGWTSRPAADYGVPFALTAKEWERSSRRNLFDAFGSDATLRVSPPSTSRLSADALSPLAHFINCHGGEGSPEFLGQDGESYPTAMTTHGISRKIKRGTVAAVECCYGAMLYPAELLDVDIAICQSYLRQGAYGFFGSTTVAYGESVRNSSADLMVKYFLLALLDGVSLGHAALKARQDFVTEVADLDPVDMKTLAQFVLLGDPSIHPVLPSDEPAPHARSKRAGRHASKAAKANAAAARERRRERRAVLAAQGQHLQETRATAVRDPKTRVSKKLERQLDAYRKAAGIPSTAKFTHYAIRTAKGTIVDAPGAARRKARRPSRKTIRNRRFHFVLKKPRGAPSGPYARAVLVKEVAGRIVDVRLYQQR